MAQCVAAYLSPGRQDSDLYCSVDGLGDPVGCNRPGGAPTPGGDDDQSVLAAPVVHRQAEGGRELGVDRDEAREVPLAAADAERGAVLVQLEIPGLDRQGLGDLGVQ